MVIRVVFRPDKQPRGADSKTEFRVLVRESEHNKGTLEIEDG